MKGLWSVLWKHAVQMCPSLNGDAPNFSMVVRCINVLVGGQYRSSQKPPKFVRGKLVFKRIVSPLKHDDAAVQKVWLDDQIYLFKHLELLIFVLASFPMMNDRKKGCDANMGKETAKTLNSKMLEGLIAAASRQEQQPRNSQFALWQKVRQNQHKTPWPLLFRFVATGWSSATRWPNRCPLGVAKTGGGWENQ